MLSEAKALTSSPELYESGFGLYSASQRAPLPLSKVNIAVDIFESVAKVRFSQTYVNTSDLLLETEYFFPIPPNARFDSFSAKYEDTTIKGVIKKKEEAKAEYNENLQKGNTVAYSEILTETPDVMKIMIGNIKPATSIEIEFSYIQDLSIVRNRFYEFMFYATLGHRYLSRDAQNVSQDTLTLASYPVIKPKEGYVWNIEVNAKCKSPITYLECRSHKVTISKSDNPCESRLILDPVEDEKLFNKNFQVLLSFENINAPTYRLAKNEQGYCIKVDFLPLFAEESLDDAIVAARQDITDHPYDSNVLTATGEYIFLIDRSGSMYGNRIEMAKQALLYALKSLPPNSYFNIYSFGSGYQALYPQSLASTEKNIDDAVQQVQSFRADMGGTEIYKPIEGILKCKSLQNMFKTQPRSLFLLTDGGVSNPEKVISLIKANSDSSRVFSLGIGNGCSVHLVQESAKAGRGCSEFVQNSADIAGKVVSLLEAAFTPLCHDFSLEFSSKDLVKMVAPAPETMPYLLRNQKVTFYIFLHGAAAEKTVKDSKGGVFSFLSGLLKSKGSPDSFVVTLKCFDTKKNKYSSSSLKVDLREYEQELDIIKLAVGEITNILERKKRDARMNNLSVFSALKNDINQEIENLSIANQVLTRRTAFICVAEEANPDATQTLKKQKVIIPQLISKDYFRQLEPIIDEDYMFQSLSYQVNTFSCQLQTKSIQPQIMRASKTFSMQHEMVNSIESYKYMKEEMYDSIDLVSSVKSLDRKLTDGSTSSRFESKSSRFDTAEKSLLDVIQSQKSLGFWEPSSQYYTVLNIDKDALLIKMPKAVGAAKENIERVAVTIALLKWIEKKYPSKKTSWNLIHRKGVQWLKSVGLQYAEIAAQIDFI